MWYQCCEKYERQCNWKVSLLFCLFANIDVFWMAGLLTVTNLRTLSICQPQGNISTADNDVAGPGHKIRCRAWDDTGSCLSECPHNTEQSNWQLHPNSVATDHWRPAWMSQPPSQAGNDNLRQCKKLNYHFSSIILLWLEYWHVRKSCKAMEIMKAQLWECQVTLPCWAWPSAGFVTVPS